MALCLVIGGKVKTTGCISYPIIYIWYLEMAMIATLQIALYGMLLLLQAGGMQVLTMFLNHDNVCLVQNVLWILRNLSDIANKQVSYR